jgi:hypothetical protein
METAHSVGHAVLQVGDAVVATVDSLGDCMLSPDIALGIAVTLLPFSPPGRELADLSRKCRLRSKKSLLGPRW